MLMLAWEYSIICICVFFPIGTKYLHAFCDVQTETIVLGSSFCIVFFLSQVYRLIILMLINNLVYI